MFLDGAHDVFGAGNIGADRLEREVLAGGDLLHGGGVDDHIGVAQRRSYAAVVAHVTDAELEQLLEIAVDNLVGGGRALLILDAHEMLFGLVSREDDDFGRPSNLTRQKALDQNLSERSGATGNQNAFILKRLHE